MSKSDFEKRFEGNPNARFYSTEEVIKLERIYNFVIQDSSKKFLQILIDYRDNPEAITGALSGCGQALFEANQLITTLNTIKKPQLDEFYEHLADFLRDGNYQKLDNFFHDNPKTMDFFNSKIRGMETIRDAIKDVEISGHDTILKDVRRLFPEEKSHVV